MCSPKKIEIRSEKEATMWSWVPFEFSLRQKPSKTLALSPFLDIIYKNANRPELLGTSEHVVFVGRKK
jgi:hypothetical protein